MVIATPVPFIYGSMTFYCHGGATVVGGRGYNHKEAELRGWGASANIYCSEDDPPKPVPLFKKKCCPKCKGMKLIGYKRDRRCTECGGKGTVNVRVD
jgi:hypothetical protein